MKFFHLANLEETSRMQGMKQVNPIEQVIRHWPSRQAFADDMGVSVDLVHKWAASGRVPAPHQSAFRDTAQSKGLHHVTGDWLVDVHAKQSGAAQ